MTISAEDWDAVLSQGWRWSHNFIGDPEENQATFEALREEYGEDKVQVAVAFDSEAMLPFPPEFDGLAAYVCDAEELLAELREDLLNWDCGHELEILETL